LVPPGTFDGIAGAAIVVLWHVVMGRLKENRMNSSLPLVWAPRMLSVLRIMAALLFMEHGLAKLFGFPAWPQHGPPAVFTLEWFSGIVEAVGGGLLALGLFTRPAAFLMSGEMAIGYFTVHFQRGFFPLLNGGDAAVLYCFLFLYFFVAGGGPWSIDRIWHDRD
jgi:putative oxidoreductase